MADFTLNAPGTTIADYQPAGIILPGHDSTHGLATDSVNGIKGKSAGGVFANDANYGLVIVSTWTYSNQTNGDLDVLGAVVRTGANAGALLGLWMSGGGYRFVTQNAAQSVTNISSFAAYPGAGGVRANGDLFTVTLTLAAGSWGITAKQNALAMTFNIAATTTWATETTIAAGGDMSATDFISQFTGTGIIAPPPSAGSPVSPRSIFIMP